MKIRKGDEVVVIVGKEKGRRGSIIRIDKQKGVLIEGVNLVKKSHKPNPNKNIPGGITEKEMYVDISNVMIFNPKLGRGDKVGIKSLGDGRKVRFFRSDEEVIDV